MIVCLKCVLEGDELVPAKIVVAAHCARCGAAPPADAVPSDYLRCVYFQPEPDGALSPQNRP